jgi:hypothetical protein
MAHHDFIGIIVPPLRGLAVELRAPTSRPARWESRPGQIDFMATCQKMSTKTHQQKECPNREININKQLQTAHKHPETTQLESI